MRRHARHQRVWRRAGWNADKGTGRADAILVLRSGFLLRFRRKIVALARKAALPTMFAHAVEAKAGGLMAYGTDTKVLFRGARTTSIKS